jgi:G3E family GTPase
VPDITVSIITGFLGSGKTSLIKHVLQHGLQQRRVAVVVNDLGEVNLDGPILAGINVDRMVELSNGCICCTIGPQFAAAMQEIVATVQPEIILIETTGAAAPRPLMDEVRRVGLRVDGLVTVVDGKHIRRLWKDTLVARQQVQAADCVVLNKCDLLSATARQQVEGFLRRHHPRALLVPSTFGQINAALLCAPGAERGHLPEDDTGAPGSAHLQIDTIEVFTYTTPRPLHRQCFERLLRQLPAEVYRVKGILHFDHDTWSSLVHYVCGRYDIEWFQRQEMHTATSQIVFVGKHLSQHQAHLLAQITACELDGVVHTA